MNDATSPAGGDCPGGAKHPRLILCAGSFGMLVYAMSSQLFAASLPSLSAEFNRNLAECGVMMVYAPAGFILCTLVSGALSDRWGQRVFLLIGFSALTIGLGLIASARTYALLCAGLFLIGTSGGFVESPISAVTANAFPLRRAQILNVLQIFFNVGAVVGPALIGLMLSREWGWRSGFGIVVVMGITAFALSIVGMPTLSHHRAAQERTGDAGKPIAWGIVTVMAVAIFLYVGGELTVAQWSAKYAHEDLGVPQSRATLVVSGFWLGMMIGRAIYVGLVGRFGHLVPLLGSAVLATGAAVLVSRSSSGSAVAWSCALTGFFFAGTWPTILGYASHRSPGRTGTVFGVLVAAGAAGWLVVPMLAGQVAQRTSAGLRAAILLGAACIFVEACVILGVLVWDRIRFAHGGHDARP